MSTIMMDNKDEILMSLVHYFVTEKDYTPIVVKGVKDEIWLENTEGPYRIIRINSNYIHNDEQFNFDIFKTKNIMKQIKKKTVSFSVNTLNIFLDVGENVNIKSVKNIDAIKVKSLKDVKKKKDLLEIFPDIKDKLITDKKGMDLIINVTKDLNNKTEKTNKAYEATFSKKTILMTKVIISLCVVMFAAMYLLGNGSNDGLTLYLFGANLPEAVKAGEIYRLITCAFLHSGIIHLLFNMYALYVIGHQVETYIGKFKFTVIYLISAISGSLMSAIFTDAMSVGASGAIFGLLGSLLYFGYHYRLYLGDVLRSQIIPLIIANLALGFILPGVDNAAHIGGLIGGYLATMALGVKGKSKKQDMINGTIVLIIYLAFLSFILFKFI
ncbi:MAG: rhomboid family intramembrane serine protease [Bacilli bacterium]|nr:rhomboid family intramembrane serine protease [Bacilli bacterium]